MEDFVKSIHAMGLKLGIYGAASGVTCGNMPGQLYHEDIDAQTYADWGIDYLKSDNCASYALDSSVRFGAMRDALNRTGKKIVLSIEPFSVDVDPEQSVKVANLWRIHCDIASNYNDITNRADISDKWSPLAGSGGWNVRTRNNSFVCVRSLLLFCAPSSSSSVLFFLLLLLLLFLLFCSLFPLLSIPLHAIRRSPIKGS